MILIQGDMVMRRPGKALKEILLRDSVATIPGNRDAIDVDFR